MRTFFSQRNSVGHGRRLIMLAAIFFSMAALPVLTPSSASADTTNSSSGGQSNAQKLQDYCQNKAKDKKLAADARKGCDVSDNMTTTINVASYSCTDKSASDMSDCIYSKAKTYIDKIINAKPKTKTDFSKGLATYLQTACNTATLKDKGCTLSQPSEAAGNSSTGKYTGPGQNCDPLDGTCADCSVDENGKAPAGCVGCENGLCQDPAADPNANCDKHSCNLVKKYLNPTINLLSISFLLLAIISIILGGVQYAASEGDPQKTSQAKNRISKTIFAIVAYFFFWAFLQFLIPGGLFD